MKAILTKYLGPTNTKGSRVKASAEGVPSMITDWDDRLNSDENHATAARMLAERYNWTRKLVSGGLPDGSVAHCFVPKD